MWATIGCLGLCGMAAASQLPLAASNDFKPTLCESVPCGHYNGIIENDFGAVVYKSMVVSDTHQRAYFMGSPGSQLLLYRLGKEEALELLAGTAPLVSADQLSMLQQCLVPGEYMLVAFPPLGSKGVEYDVWLARDPNGYGRCQDESISVAEEEPMKEPRIPDLPSMQTELTGDRVQQYDSTPQPQDQMLFDFSQPMAGSNSAPPQGGPADPAMADYPSYAEQPDIAPPTEPWLGNHGQTIGSVTVVTSQQSKETDSQMPYMGNNDLGIAQENSEEEGNFVASLDTQNFDWIASDSETDQPMGMDTLAVPPLSPAKPEQVWQVSEGSIQQSFGVADDVLVGSNDWYYDWPELPPIDKDSAQFASKDVVGENKVWLSTPPIYQFSAYPGLSLEPSSTATSTSSATTQSETVAATGKNSIVQSNAPAGPADSQPQEQPAPMMAVSVTEQRLTAAVIVTGCMCLLLLILLLLVLCVWISKKRNHKPTYVFNTALELPKSVTPKKNHPKMTNENLTALELEKTAAWYASPVIKHKNQNDQTSLSRHLDLDGECGDDEEIGPVAYQVTIPVRGQVDEIPPAYPPSPVSDECSSPLSAAVNVPVSESVIGRANRRETVDDDSVWHNVDLASQARK